MGCVLLRKEMQHRRKLMLASIHIRPSHKRRKAPNYETEPVKHAGEQPFYCYFCWLIYNGKPFKGFVSSHTLFWCFAGKSNISVLGRIQQVLISAVEDHKPDSVYCLHQRVTKANGKNISVRAPFDVFFLISHSAVLIPTHLFSLGSQF